MIDDGRAERDRRELDRRLLAEARRRESGWQLRRFLILALVAVGIIAAGAQRENLLFMVGGGALLVLAMWLAFFKSGDAV